MAEAGTHIFRVALRDRPSVHRDIEIDSGQSLAKLAEALDDRASFRRFCGFAAHEPTPERTAFVRFRRELVRAGWTGHCSRLSRASSKRRG